MSKKTKAPKTSSKPEKEKTQLAKAETAEAQKPAPKKAEAKKPAPKKADAKKTDKKSNEPTGVKKVFASIKRFFKDVRSETKKIVWNSKEDTIKNTGVVLLVTLVVGAGVWIADLLFGELRELVFSLADPGAAQAGMIMLQSLIDLL